MKKEQDQEREFQLINVNKPHVATTPLPAIFDGLPYPPGGSRDFFHQTDPKGCTLDYLDGLGHVLFGFGATGKKISMGR